MGNKKMAVFVLSLFLLAGCGRKQTTGLLNQEPIDCSKAVEFILSPDESSQDVLLQESFAEKKGETNGDTYYEVDVCRRNEESGFFTVSHAKDMAQYTYLNQIYRVDLKTDSREMLYETKDAYWLNEFEAVDHFLYWVEFVSPGDLEDPLFRVLQCDLTTGEVECIAEKNGAEVEELCLAVSERYVVWYDHYRKEDRTEIVIYDSDKKDFHTLSEVKVVSPYARLDIIDGGITYFSEAEEGNIFINRYDLDTRTIEAKLMISVRGGNQLLKCFSSDRYMGWELDEGDAIGNRYCFYDRKDGSLYSICCDNGVSVFSEWLSDYVYLNCSGSDMLVVFDPASGRMWKQKLEGNGMQFREYDSGQVYLEVRTDEEAKLFTIEVPKK